MGGETPNPLPLYGRGDTLPDPPAAPRTTYSASRLWFGRPAAAARLPLGTLTPAPLYKFLATPLAAVDHINVELCSKEANAAAALDRHVPCCHSNHLNVNVSREVHWTPVGRLRQDFTLAG